jgi:hypothetical protein
VPNQRGMRRALAVGLLVMVAAADGAGAHGVAFYALLLAVPAAAVVALEAFGNVLDGSGDRLHAVLWTVVLALVVCGAAVRAPLVTEGAVPGFARSALVACLAIVCVQAVLGLVAEIRR